MQIKIHSIRHTKTFDTKEEAAKWADGLLQGCKEDLKKSKQVPKIKSTDRFKIDEQQILDSSSPFIRYIGVYFLIHKGKIIYVGQSTDVYNRLTYHLHKGREFTHFSFVECPVEMLDDLEHHYIITLNPPENIDKDKRIITPKSRRHLDRSLHINYLTYQEIRAGGATVPSIDL